MANIYFFFIKPQQNQKYNSKIEEKYLIFLGIQEYMNTCQILYWTVVIWTMDITQQTFIYVYSLQKG